MEFLLPEQHRLLENFFDRPQHFRTSIGGHMAYRRVLFDDAKGNSYFVKAHDPALLQEEWRRDEMLYFLNKEARVYEHLDAYGFAHVPSIEMFNQNMFVLEGLTKQQGWYWRAPDDQQLHADYVVDTLSAFRALEQVPALPNIATDEISVDTFYNHGWDKLHDLDIECMVTKNIERWRNMLHAETPGEAQIMLQAISELAVKRIHMRRDIFNHHDARQSNIAWHPEYGTRLVDWSWADGGLQAGDATMFLLDLHKADHDVSSQATFNETYAKMMLGYWLQRSQTEHMEGNETVRMQQFVSAIKASQLILQLRNKY